MYMYMWLGKPEPVQMVHISWLSDLPRREYMYIQVNKTIIMVAVGLSIL